MRTTILGLAILLVLPFNAQAFHSRSCCNFPRIPTFYYYDTFFSELSINGIALEDANGLTDPTISVLQGESLSITFESNSGTAHPFSFDFFDLGGSTLNEPNILMDTSVYGTNIIDFDFGIDVGTFVGGIDLLATDVASTNSRTRPNYRAADDTVVRINSTPYRFLFTLQVDNRTSSSTSIPEPGVLALFSIGLIILLIGESRARQWLKQVHRR